jgi:hypothetical protein
MKMVTHVNPLTLNFLNHATMASNLLAAAAEKQLPQLDEKFFFEVFSTHRRVLKKEKIEKGNAHGSKRTNPTGF